MYAVKKLDLIRGEVVNLITLDTLSEARQWACSHIMSSYKPLTVQIHSEKVGAIEVQYVFDYDGQTINIAIIEL